MVVGNIGRKKDLSKLDKLNSLLEDLLTTTDEEMKINIAICIGNLALGNKAFYIPRIMSKLKASPQLGYLMLVALREIVALDEKGVTKNLEDLLPVLKAQAETEDEGNRSIVAEIIGKLLISSPEKVVPEVERELNNKSDSVRATYALAFKYWYGRGKNDLSGFNLLLPKLFELFADRNVKVQKALLEALNHVTHQNAACLRFHGTSIFKGTLPMTVLRKELIKTVDLGPVQHKIDDGEPIRKGAYLLLDNMLTEVHDKMDLSQIADRLIDGLADESDEVQNSCQQILIKLCAVNPGTVLGPLEKLLEKISDATHRLQERINRKQDIDRSSDNLRGFLRVIIAMDKLPDIDLNDKYQEYRKKIFSNKPVLVAYEELKKIS